MVNKGPFCDGEIYSPRDRSAHFLFRMRTRARPFCDNILAGFIVGCKGKCDTGEGGTKVDTDNELCFVAIGALDLDGGVAILVLGHRLLHRVTMTL